MAEIGTRSDPTRVLLGCPRRGPETVGNYPIDGSSLVDPGVAGCLNSDGEFVAGAANPLVGISRGRSQTHPKRNSVTQKGYEVPLKLTDLGVQASGLITITNVSNLLADSPDEITVGEVVFVAQSTAVTPGDATFRANGTTAATATSLAAQINAHPDLEGVVTAEADGAEVTVTAVEVGEDGNTIALAYSDEGTETVGATVSDANLEGGYESFDYVVPGEAVFIDDATGFATEDGEGATESNWRYDSGVLDGVSQTAGVDSVVPCALVNM